MVLLRRYALIIRYLLAGGTGASVNIGALYVLKEFAGLHYLAAGAAAFIMAYAVSFTLQKFWTFEDRTTDRIHGQAVLYLAVFTLNFFLNLAALYLLVEKAHLWYIFAQVIASGSIAVSSFFIYKYFIFVRRATFQADI